MPLPSSHDTFCCYPSKPCKPYQSHYSLMQAPHSQEFIASSIACGWVKIMQGRKLHCKHLLLILRGLPQSVGLRLPCGNPSRCYSRLQYIRSSKSRWSAKTPRGQAVNADLSQKNLAFCSCTPSWLHGRKKIEKPSTITPVLSKNNQQHSRSPLVMLRFTLCLTCL